MKEARELTVSLLYHIAANRQCKNPTEDTKVVAITNYLDLGLQVPPPPSPLSRPIFRAKDGKQGTGCSSCCARSGLQLTY